MCTCLTFLSVNTWYRIPLLWIVMAGVIMRILNGFFISFCKPKHYYVVPSLLWNSAFSITKWGMKNAVRYPTLNLQYDEVTRNNLWLRKHFSLLRASWIMIMILSYRLRITHYHYRYQFEVSLPPWGQCVHRRAYRQANKTRSGIREWYWWGDVKLMRTSKVGYDNSRSRTRPTLVVRTIRSWW